MWILRSKTTILALLSVVLVAIAALTGAGWHASNMIRDGVLKPKRGFRHFDLEIVELEKDRITLRTTAQTQKDSWKRPGIWGLRWPGGYAQVGEIHYMDDQNVVRKFVPLTGNLKRLDKVRLDEFAFPDDPGIAFRLPTQEVVYSSPLGEFRALYIRGRSTTWIIFVHGKRDHPPRKPLRSYPIVPLLTELGHHSLIITYRNDVGALPSPDDFHWHGLTEWIDLEGAARWAVGHGAERVILFGYSMGGGIVMNFLYRSALAENVKGAVLDSPMLDLGATIDFVASQKNMPGPLVRLGKFIAGLRFEIDWKALDYLSRVDTLLVPILLFHGDADSIVPVETSDLLAKRRPGIVTYHRIPNATHIRSWNMNSAAYETAVHAFLKNALRENK
jgi:alpha-beta hydrolase superfamily lysophospholipase